QELTQQNHTRKRTNWQPDFVPAISTGNYNDGTQNDARVTTTTTTTTTNLGEQKEPKGTESSIASSNSGQNYAQSNS
ncbi:MAG: hypothetical protein N6V41_01305, partial [Candidatus Portiera aleyrodidarum]|nr:hypothetical protein [Candidatus Portiera aleyrodidarum]